MCTGLLGICACNHYQIINWTSRCENGCKYPTNWLQYVDFQCHLCDHLDQSLLELEIKTQAKLNHVEKWALEALERDRRDIEMDREMVRRMCYTGDMTAADLARWEIDLETKSRSWRDTAMDQKRRRRSEILIQHDVEAARLEEEAQEKMRGSAVAEKMHRSSHVFEDGSRKREI